MPDQKAATITISVQAESFTRMAEIFSRARGPWALDYLARQGMISQETAVAVWKASGRQWPEPEPDLAEYKRRFITARRPEELVIGKVGVGHHQPAHYVTEGDGSNPGSRATAAAELARYNTEISDKHFFRQIGDDGLSPEAQAFRDRNGISQPGGSDLVSEQNGSQVP